MRRASSWRDSIAVRIASVKRAVTEMSCALSSVVTARRGPPSRGDSSWLQVTGLPVRSRMASRACSSWAALRTLNCAATAYASTEASTPSSARSSSSTSSGPRSSPWAPWPPPTTTTGADARLPVSRSRPLPAGDVPARSLVTSPAPARSPTRARVSGSKPMATSAAGRPAPSTRALVASVVETATSPMSAAPIASAEAPRPPFSTLVIASTTQP